MSQFNNAPVSFWIGKQRTGVSIEAAGVTYVPPIPYFTGAATGELCPATYDITAQPTGTGPTPAPPQPVSGPPTVPVVNGTPTMSSITVYFDVAGITGAEPIIYTARLYTSPSAIPLSLSASLVSGTTWAATASGLTAATGYYFKSVASNTIGGITHDMASALSQAIDTAGGTPAAPSGPPTIPVLNVAHNTDIVVNFDVTGITGVPTPSYSILWGTTTTPTTPATATFTSGNTWSATALGLTPHTVYYFKSVATNSQGSQTSAVSAGFMTTVVGEPSKAPTVPVVVSVTDTSITASFDVAGITGVTPFSYFLVCDTPSQTVAATLVSGTVWSATITGLVANTLYNISSKVTNSVYFQQSANAVLKTAGPPVGNPGILSNPMNGSIIFSAEIPDTTGVTSNPPYVLSGVYYKTAEGSGASQSTGPAIFGGPGNISALINFGGPLLPNGYPSKPLTPNTPYTGYATYTNIYGSLTTNTLTWTTYPP